MAQHGDLQVPIIEAHADEQAKQPAQEEILEEREHERSLNGFPASQQRCMSTAGSNLFTQHTSLSSCPYPNDSCNSRSGENARSTTGLATLLLASRRRSRRHRWRARSSVRHAGGAPCDATSFRGALLGNHPRPGRPIGSVDGAAFLSEARPPDRLPDPARQSHIARPATQHTDGCRTSVPLFGARSCPCAGRGHGRR